MFNRIGDIQKAFSCLRLCRIRDSKILASDSDSATQNAYNSICRIPRARIWQRYT